MSTDGLDDQRARDREHLPLAARQRAGAARGPLGEVGEHGVERGDALGPRFSLGRMSAASSRLSWIDSVAKMFSVCGTKARPCRTFSCAGDGGDVDVAEAHRAGMDRHQPGDRLDEGRLAGAVRPEHDDQLARRTARSTPRTIGRSRS